MRSAAAVSLLLLSSCTVQRWKPVQTATMDDHMAHMSATDRSSPSTTLEGRTSQGTVGLPGSAATAEARLKASPRHGEWVKVAWEPGSADSLMAWIVYPIRQDKAPVVVVIHEIFGLQTWVRGVADQVAADGFIAIAPDILSRIRGGPSTVELSGDSARKLISGIGFAERNRAITAVAKYAMSQPSAVQRYGVVGYCWGGSTAWGAAVAGGQGFGGAVAYYGVPFMTPAPGPQPGGTPTVVPNPDSLAKITMPVMLLNGALDARIGAAMPAIDSTMRALGKSYLGKNYDGAIHGFLRAQDDPGPNNAPGNQANLAAAKDAWPMTIAFFRKNLRPIQ
jgi:carboxymethylenebutenolidase